jgi:hypothetical protein
VGKEAAMMDFSGDAPFNIISLFIFYYAIDGKKEQRSLAGIKLECVLLLSIM